MKLLIFSFVALAISLVFCIGAQGLIIELFEDDEEFINNVQNQDAPTTIENDDADSFNGGISLRLESDSVITNGQKYNPNIPGWAWQIVDRPSGEDEARWIMFAWKKDDGDGIMIQFPDSGSWGVVTNGGRYFDGVNKTGWPGIQLEEEAPREWEVQIRDLVDDFDEFTMSGIALTQYDNVGRYDSIYLAWTEDELQQLLTDIFPVEPLSKLTTTWGDVKTFD